MAPDHRNIPLGFALGFIGVVIFGASVPATKLAVGELDPWFVTFARALIAACFAAPLLFLFKKRLPKRLWLTSTLASLCLVIGFPSFLALALLDVPAAHSGVVLGLLPLTTAVMAVIAAQERPSPAFWMWAAIGAVTITIFTIGDGPTGFLLGDLWLVLAALSASLGYAFSGTIARERPGWEVISWQIIIALPIALIGTLISFDPNVTSAGWPALAGLGYLGVFSMFLGFFFWNAGLAMGGIARVGQVQLLQTFVTLFFSWLVLSEAIGPRTQFFALLIVIVIFFARKARIAEAQI
ncbi:MAG: DMT family transporter [Pseudomonadota bacterium]